MLDDRSRRETFPSLEGMTYLNTAAEGIPPAPVGDALARYFSDKQRGSPAREQHMAEWEAARAAAADLFGLPAGAVGICSCSSEAFNLAALALDLQPGDEVIINDLDFPAGRTPWLQPSCRATARLWQSREGALRVEDLLPLLGPRTRLVSASLVSFHNGFMLPLPAVVDAVRKHSPAFLALDVTQALGRVPLALSGVDLIVSSTHKWILGTHGGGLIGIPEERAHDLTTPAGGWFNLQEPFEGAADERVRSKPGAASYMVGMPNFPAVYAIRAALEFIRGVGVPEIDRTARPLVAACLEGLRSLPVELITPGGPESLAGILAFRHPAMETIFTRLKAQKIHVMHSAGRIRVSLHGYNTMADVETFLRALANILESGL
jgi:cysteine desulfurase / selenocysteine lyase